jgi:hypothetical protein
MELAGPARKLCDTLYLHKISARRQVAILIAEDVMDGPAAPGTRTR